MNQLNRNFTRIASEHLNIPTLRTRNCDGLDFHEVSVWAVRATRRIHFSTQAPAYYLSFHRPG
jgi:hypothetical protein